jgi:uncharacterized cofD-like protein
VTSRSALDGPAVVAIGGGHGLAATLRASRSYAGSITAIVSVADDGGSSGRLRAALPAMPAPGDLRRCLSSLAASGSLLGEALEHRFDEGDLDGHALGNLLIAGLAECTGDFVAALDEVGRLVGAVGRVLPAATEPVTLRADRPGSGATVGQVAVQQSGGVERLRIEPPDPAVPDDAVEAILQADQVVIGPGSLYTSVLAAATTPRLRAAIAATAAQRVYVGNLMPQVPETAGYDLAAHVSALRDHGIEIDHVLAHGLDGPAGPAGGLRVPTTVAPLASDDGDVHDPKRLAASLSGLWLSSR